MNKEKRTVMKRWLGVLFWTVILFGLVPFLRIEFVWEYQWKPLVWMLALVYVVVVIWGTGVLIGTLRRVKDGTTKMRVFKFIMKRLYYIFLWPVALYIDAIVYTVKVFRKKDERVDLDE